jgi:hypothetical protein
MHSQNHSSRSLLSHLPSAPKTPPVKTARLKTHRNIPTHRSLPPSSSPIKVAQVATSVEAPETSGKGPPAKGVGKGAGDLVTLHPLDAAGNIGKGGAVAGKDVGVGAAKGTGKIAKGTGRGIGKLFHHHHETQTAPVLSEPKD